MKKSTVRFITFLSMMVFGIQLCFATATLSQKSPLIVSYIQNAQVATLQPTHGNHGQLLMHITNPYMMYVSDRPNRVVGQIPLSLFYSKWQAGKNSFGKDAPNAVLAGVIKVNGKYQPLNLAIELSAPRYNTKKATVTYHIHLLKGSMSLPPKSEQVYETTLLIDQACLSCVG